jgi:hypothetical protein
MSTANPFDVWFAPHERLGGKSLMDHLYNRLDGAYPHKWKSNFPSQQAIDNWSVSWAEAFEEEGIKPRDIKAGIKVCRAKYGWPPSCSEFINACKPPLDTVAAYYEAVNGVVARERGEVGNWTHPAIFWASVTMSHDLKNMSYSSVKDRWERALSEQLAKAKWEPNPAPAPALPPPGKGRSDKANAERMLAQYRAGCKNDGKKTDRDWIGKVLERAKNGDESLPHLSLVFAKMALKTEMD